MFFSQTIIPRLIKFTLVSRASLSTLGVVKAWNVRERGRLHWKLTWKRTARTCTLNVLLEVCIDLSPERQIASKVLILDENATTLGRPSVRHFLLLNAVLV